MVFVWIEIAIIALALIAFLRDDWGRIARPSRTAVGLVYNHLRSADYGGDRFAAMIRFETAKGDVIEIVDPAFFRTPRPQVGAKVKISYPEALPALARIPRPLSRGLVYLVLTSALLVLIGRAMGALPEGGAW